MKDKHRIGFAASVYLISVAIIIGYYWLFGGYFGKCNYSFSQYAAMNYWSSAVFLVCNLIIVAFLISLIRANRNQPFYWYIVMSAIVIGLIGLSFCPDGLFDAYEKIHWTTYAHKTFAGITFTGIVIATLLALKNNWKEIKKAFPITVYLICTFAFMITFALSITYSTSYVLVWEVLYLLAFYVIIAATKTPSA